MYDILIIFAFTSLLASIPLWWFYSKLTKVSDPPRAKTLERAAVSIPSAGGFDRLCITDCCVNLGANIENCKHGIYSKIPKETLLRNSDTYVVVEIHSIGVNYADCCIRWGLYASAKKYVGWPITPGFEFSGRVLEIIEKGETDKKFEKGDEVFGVSLFGAYSTHIVVPARQLFHKPSQLTMDQCGGFLCTAITAYYALFELGGLHFLPHVQSFIAEKTAEFYNFENVSKVTKRPPVAVLIHSASGGVGSMLVQLCKKVALIELVIGVVGNQTKVKLAKEMGCDYVICRRDKSGVDVDIWKEMKKQIPTLDGFDIVFDANGISTLKNSFRHLKPTGKLIVYGAHSILPHTGIISIKNWVGLGFAMLRTPTFNPMDLIQENRSVLGFNLSFLFSRMDRLEESMANILTWVNQNKLTVAKVTTYKFEDVWKEHRDLQSGETIGKLVLQTVHNNSSSLKR